MQQRTAVLNVHVSLQVSQLGWDGSVHAVCHLAGGSMPVLAGALADRLLIARGGASGGRVNVSPRCLALLQPLLLGWATVAATDCLPGEAQTYILAASLLTWPWFYSKSILWLQMHLGWLQCECISQ